MNCVWKQVIFSGVILCSLFNAGYCERTCETLDDCYGSTEFTLFYSYVRNYPSLHTYDPSDICDDSDSDKVWCDRSQKILQEDAICGTEITFDILRSPKTRINEFPWMALLQYTDGKTIETSCQGVLITNEFVLTTATCIKRNTNGFNLTSVILGEWDKTTVVDCDNSSGAWICNNPPVVVPIRGTRINAFFHESSHNYNTGMIQLEHKVEYTDFIKPICLPYFGSHQFARGLHPARKYVIASWGETSPGGRKSEILLKVDLDAVDCPSDSVSHLCIHSTRRKNVCAGDEGAPIMGSTILRNRTFVYLAGIVSNNNVCRANEGPIFLGDRVFWSI